LNAKLNPICHLLALLGAHPILHVSRIRVNKKILTLKKAELFTCRGSRACITQTMPRADMNTDFEARP
jgi:hypothetical protein